MTRLKACLLPLTMALAVGPTLAETPSSCLVGTDKVALAAGVRADTVRDAPECRLTWEQAGVMIGFPPPPDKLVTAKNYNTYPFNRWMLQNVSRFTRTAPMLTARPAPRPLPETRDPAILDTKLSVNGVERTIADYADQTFVDALVVVKDGALVAEWYGDGMTASKPHYIASVTKSVTGFLAELLIADGRLDETRLVKSYIPELANSPFGEATVRDVLDMKVNVGAGETSGVVDPAEAAMWTTMALNGRQSVYNSLASVKADGPNDGRFHYASLTTEVAGWLITRAANEPYEKLASDLIWSKLGLEDDVYGAVDPEGKVYSSTALTISARDLAKFGLMIANRGQVDGKQVFPTTVVDRLFATGDEDAWKNGAFRNNSQIRAYRSYWYQLDGSDHAIVGLGVFGQALYINPARRLVMVRYSSTPVHTILEYAKGWEDVRTWLESQAAAKR